MKITVSSVLLLLAIGSSSLCNAGQDANVPIPPSADTELKGTVTVVHLNKDGKLVTTTVNAGDTNIPAEVKEQVKQAIEWQKLIQNQGLPLPEGAAEAQANLQKMVEKAAKEPGNPNIVQLGGSWTMRVVDENGQTKEVAVGPGKVDLKKIMDSIKSDGQLSEQEVAAAKTALPQMFQIDENHQCPSGKCGFTIMAGQPPQDMSGSQALSDKLDKVLERLEKIEQELAHLKAE